MKEIRATDNVDESKSVYNDIVDDIFINNYKIKKIDNKIINFHD